jgi:tetratricopeptide (TPR) repeat protein
MKESGWFRVLVLALGLVAAPHVAAEEAESAFFLGGGYHDHFVLAAALHHYSRAIELDPEYGEAYAARGLAHAQAGLLESAFSDLRRALALGERGFEVQKNYAQLLLVLGRTEEAEPLVARLLRRKPKHAGLWVLQGDLLAATGRQQEAVDAYSRALDLDPYSTQAVERRAEAYAALGSQGQAAQDAERMVALNPKDTAGYLRQARILAANGDTKAALYAMRGVWQLDPQREGLTREVAVLLQQEGAWDLAADWWLRVVADPATRAADKIEAWEQLAYGFYQQEYWPAALYSYQRVVQLQPNNRAALEAQAAIYQRQQAWQAAEAVYARLIAGPTHKPFDWYQRALIRMQLDYWQGALEDLTAAIVLGEAGVQAFANRAAVHQRLENYPAMLRDVETALPLAQGDLRHSLEATRHQLRSFLYPSR